MALTNSNFTIDASAIASAGAVLRRNFKGVAGKHVEQTLSKAGSAVSREARKEAGRHTKTGKMRSRIRSYRTGKGLDAKVRIRAGGPVAHLVIGGVRPHDEDVRDADALAIAPIGGGITDFAASVHHPGFRGDPFFERGIEDALPEIKVYMQLATDQVAGDLAKQIIEASGLKL